MIVTIISLYGLGFLCELAGLSLDNFSGLFVVLVVSFVAVFELSRYAKPYSSILTGAYFVRIALLIFDIFGRNIYKLPNSGADTSLYHNMAKAVAEGGLSGRGGIYSEIVASLYKLYGPSQIIGQLLNVVIGVWSIVLIIKCIDKLGIDQGITGIKLFSFLPNIVILNCILLRETPIMFLLSFSLYLYVCWIKDGGILSIFFAYLMVFFATMLHSGAVAPVIAYTLVAVLYNRRQQTISLSISTILFSVVFAVAFVFVFSKYGDSLFAKFSDSNIESLVAGQSSAEGGSAYIIGFNTGNSFVSFIISSPIRMLYFMFSPFPWQWRNLSDIIAFVFSSCFYAISIIKAVQALRHSEKADSIHVLIVLTIIMAIASSFVFGWGVSNVGTALRHRDKFAAQFVLMYILSSFEITRNQLQAQARSIGGEHEYY